MLIGLRRANPGFLRENKLPYGLPSFPHERLDVYQAALQLAEWTHELHTEARLAARQRNRLDITTTGTLLNIAEGCGKSSKADKRKFLDISYSQALQTALLLDLVVAQGGIESRRLTEGKDLLERIAAMLIAWTDKLHKETGAEAKEIR